MINFQILQYILISICLITIINLYLELKLRHTEIFNRFILFFNVYLGFHALYAFVIEQFFVDKPYLDRLAPFALMYGPFLYFAFIIIRCNSISIRRIIIHSTLFVLFCMGFAVVLLLGVPAELTKAYRMALGIVSILSTSGYTLWVIVSNPGVLNYHLKPRKLMIIAGILLLLFITMIGIAVLYSRNYHPLTKQASATLIRAMVYGCMFCGALLVFRYEIHFILMKSRTADGIVPKKDDTVMAVAPEGKYEKSTLTSEQLSDYAERLKMLMQVEEVYLYNDLSLKKLAWLMRLPNHHLTQVFSLNIKQNFYEYVNGYRVRYACLLLKEEKTATLETISGRSGFNSKISFNRHFKSIMGCTPSEYRSESK